MKPLKQILKDVRRGIAIVAGAAAVGLTGTVAADPITFLPSATDLQIKFQNREVQIVSFGQELFGIFNITSITNSLGTVTFWSGNGVSDGTQLVGFFENLTAIPDQTGGGGLSFIGGDFVIYDVTNGLYSPTTTPNIKNFANQLCGGVCPTPWLSGDFVAGINDSLGPTGDATLQAAIASTNVQAGF